MAKYKLHALNVQIGGILHLKESDTTFDTDGKFAPLKKEVEAAYKAGYLGLVDGKKLVLYNKREAEAKAEAEAKTKEAEAEAKAEAEAEVKKSNKK